MSSSPDIVDALKREPGAPLSEELGQSLSRGGSGELTSLERTIAALGLTIAFCAPLKLSWTYVFFIPALLALAVNAWRKREFLTVRCSSDKALLVFLTVSTFVSVFSLAPLVSLSEILRFGALFLVLPIFRITAKAYGVFGLLTTLICAQAFSAFDSVIDFAIPGEHEHLFVGQMSESGQLAMTLFALLTLMLFQKRQLSSLTPALMVLSLSVLLFLSMPITPLPTGARILLLALLGVFVLAILFTQRGRIVSALPFFLSPFLVAALVLNLKRGPIIGATASLGLWLVFHKKFKTIAALALFVLAMGYLDPIRERFFASYQDFTISGGRSTIWDIGVEMATRYPLGIGFDQSELLQSYSSTIPANLTHFHNNLLNLLVELGWLPTALFIWWFLECIGYGRFLQGRDAVATLSFGLVAWQLAGFVEYNIGDTEVLLVALLIVACIQVLAERKGEIGTTEVKPPPASA